MRQTAAVTLFSAALMLAACGGPGGPVAATTTPTTPTSISSTSSSSSSTTTTNTPSTTTAITVPPPASEYEFSCYDADSNEVAVASMAEVIKQKLTICDITVKETHKPSANEIRAVREYRLFNSGETTQGALETMLGICVDDEPLEEQAPWDNHVLRGTLMLCPKSPRAAEMKTKTSGNTIDDGDYAVGVDINPGTYRTAKGMSDCYWERTTKGGATIANDFVTYAPAGVTVTIRPSDGGFSSEGCGPWKRVR